MCLILWARKTISYISSCMHWSFFMSRLCLRLRILEQAAGHLRWRVDYPPSQPVGSGFEPHWRSQPAKLPLFGGYSLETLPYLMSRLAVALLDWRPFSCDLCNPEASTQASWEWVSPSTALIPWSFWRIF